MNSTHRRSFIANQVWERVLFCGHDWGKDHESFYNALDGSLGTPPEGFVIVWKDSEFSRERLGDNVFNHLVFVIRDHGPGGEYEEDEIKLRLE